MDSGKREIRNSSYKRRNWPRKRQYQERRESGSAKRTTGLGKREIVSRRRGTGCEMEKRFQEEKEDTKEKKKRTWKKRLIPKGAKEERHITREKRQ